MNIQKQILNIYRMINPKSKYAFKDIEFNYEITQKIISDRLLDDEPCMISRFGSIELDNIVNYIKTKCHKNNNESTTHFLNALCTFAGFFPKDDYIGLKKFCDLYIKDSLDIDILGCWQKNERYLSDRLNNTKKVLLPNLDPFFSISPWTKYLKGKKVLVIHSFAETIKRQYLTKRKYLFKNSDTLPEFDLITIKAIQSIGGEPNGFMTWFDALHHMESQMDVIDYDVALIGCGAYGLPLAAHAKRNGKKAVHLGGSLQLLFGIMGNRWFDPKSGLYNKYSVLLNDFWVRPMETERPKNADNVEGACYW